MRFFLSMVRFRLRLARCPFPVRTSSVQPACRDGSTVDVGIHPRWVAPSGADVRSIRFPPPVWPSAVAG